MSRKRRRKRWGHYCWSCDRVLANERFSGKGHARHICRECSKLGSAELARRQAIRDLERCLTDDGRVRLRCRKQFAQFRNHADPVVRQMAEEVLAGRLGVFPDDDDARWNCFDGSDLIGVWIENDSFVEEDFIFSGTAVERSGTDPPSKL